MAQNKKLISAIVPCYNEEEAIPFFYEEITRVAAQMTSVDFEFIFIDDGSSDRTLEVLREYAQKDKRVRYVSFSRNFGKESAMYAGLEASKGDYVAIMDADLQDPPSLLPEMLGYIENEGYDSVSTRRSNRKGEPPIRSLFARIFYGIINKISKVKMTPGARDFSLMKRKVVDAILSLPEYNRFTKGIVNWVGFKVKWLSYNNIQRVAGKTKWSFWKLFKYSIECIVAFSTAPLGILVIIIRPFAGVASAAGWASTLCVVLFVGGVQLFCTGILGTYISKTYLETKSRPLYITAETEKDLEENKIEEKEQPQ